MTVEYLDVEDLLALVERLRVGPVRDLGSLAACAQRPAATVFGHDTYPNVAEKAAALLHGIVRFHPLVDGNKRLGWLACVVFLDVNGREVGLSENDAFALVMELAAHDRTVAELAQGLLASPRGRR